MGLSAAAILAIIGQALKEGDAIGGGVSNLFGAYGVMTPEEEARLKELKSLKESGSLGLSSDAMKSLQLSALAPQQAQERESQQKMAAAYGAAGASPADLARAQQGASQQRAERLQPSMGELATAQEDERRLQEQQILNLARAQEDEKRAKQKAWTEIITAMLGVSGDTMQGITEAQAGESAKTSAVGEGDAASEDQMKIDDEASNYMSSLYK